MDISRTLDALLEASEMVGKAIQAFANAHAAHHAALQALSTPQESAATPPESTELAVARAADVADIEAQRAANVGKAMAAAALAAGAPPAGAYVLIDGKPVAIAGAPAIAHTVAPVASSTAAPVAIVEVKAKTEVDHAAIRRANPHLFPHNPGQDPR